MFHCPSPFYSFWIVISLYGKHISFLLDFCKYVLVIFLFNFTCFLLTEFLTFVYCPGSSLFSSFGFSNCFVFRRSFPFLICDKYSLFPPHFLKVTFFVHNCLIRLEFIQTTTISLTPLCLKKMLRLLENIWKTIYGEEN